MEVTYGAISKLIGGNKNSETVETPEQGSAAVDNNVESTPNSAIQQKTSAVQGSTTDDSTVDFTTDSAVQHEQVNKVHEEKVQEVVEKEKHQDHYHTTVQPLTDREVLPEEHSYQQASTQERNFSHEDQVATKAELKDEKEQFKDTSTESAAVEYRTQMPAVSGEEHVHHHLHETIQPVVEKETVKTYVTHTKVPVHEVHQEASVIHDTSVAKPMSVDEFKANGNTAPNTE